MTRSGVEKLLRDKIKRCESQYRAAEALGIKPTYLSDILSGKREPGGAVLQSLGLERVVTYRKFKSDASA